MAKLVVFTGLLGTGKSTLAKALAEKRNWRLLQIDKLRNLMIPNPVYNTEEMKMMYQVMLASAEVWLKNSLDVILDATFSLSCYHRLLEKVSKKVKAELRVIRCVCSDKTAAARLEKRMALGLSDAKDTTKERYFVHKRYFREIDFCPVKIVNTEKNFEKVLAEVLDYLEQ